MEAKSKAPKILLVANVAKEHVLKFHVPTLKMLYESGWHVEVACSGDEDVPYCHKQHRMLYKRSPFNLALFKGIKQLKKIVDEGEYDIVYCHTPVGALAARLASMKARKKGTQVIYMAHGHYFFKGGPLIYWLTFYPIEKILSVVTDSMMLINKEDYELTKNKFHHKKNTYLLNGIGVNLERFVVENKEGIRKQYREELGIPQDATVLIYLAELLPNKNQTMLMRSLKSILAENKNVYLVLAGVDHSDGKFMKYAEEIGVQNNVRYLGWRSDVANLYAMADICTPTSIREGLGLNLIEAMKSGLPVVATDNRGHRTIIEDNVNGFLVPLNDEELYTKKIKELINNKELCKKFIENGNITTEKYSSDAVVEKIEGILKAHL